MSRRLFFILAILALIQFSLGIALPPPSLAQEWKFRRPKGTLKVVDLSSLHPALMHSYSEGLVTLDKDNNWVPCLAEDWRWISDRTIEFKLRRGVTFHNGERFDAEAVRINWEAYRRMKSASPFQVRTIPDETIFETIDENMVRFTFPEPDGLAFVKFMWFFQFAPAFFEEHEQEEHFWGHLMAPGPWCTGPFKLIEGDLRHDRQSPRIVLEAYEDYWDPRYPKVKRLIFDNTLIGNRKEAMRLCRETEGSVDIVSFIRPLDTLKVAESPFAKVVKSKDVANLGALFNQRKRGSKWRDVRLRKAVNYAINRKELWKYAAKGNAHNFGIDIPPGAYGYNPNLIPYTYDTTRARALLAEAGYPEGFEVKIITPEAWKLEAQIIRRMLWRIGLNARFDVFTYPEFLRKTFMLILDRPPEEQDWDLCLGHFVDAYGHTGVSFFVWYTEGSNFRWIEYDPVYEELWNDMAKTMDPEAQEEKIRQISKYVHENAFHLTVYSPLSLYAVNKEVNFVPQKCQWLRLKETSVTDNHWSVRAEKK